MDRLISSIALLVLGCYAVPPLRSEASHYCVVHWASTSIEDYAKSVGPITFSGGGGGNFKTSENLREGSI